MENWFGARSDYPFELFAWSHIIVLGIAFAGFLMLAFLKNRIAEQGAVFQSLRWLLLMVLALSEVSYHYWAITHGLWRFSHYMPLHLCGVASFTCMIGLLTLRPFWLRLAFFIAIVPASLALVTPDMPYDYQHYRFWKFFVHHIAIAWAGFFLALSQPKVITLRSVFMVYGLLLMYAAIIGFFVNPATGANYLYLARQPESTSLLGIFGDGIWYYVNLCITALLLFLIQYGVFHVSFKRRGEGGGEEVSVAASQQRLKK